MTPVLDALLAALQRRHGPALRAVLYYGSCLRGGDPAAGIVDFHVLVTTPHAAGQGWVASFFNDLLPPNVFYLETPATVETGRVGRIWRAKYAMFRERAFLRGVAGRWLLPYLWGRFAQPYRLVWCADSALEENLARAVARGRRHFLATVTATLDGEYTVPEIWRHGIGLSYRTELRTEPVERIASLIAAGAAEFRSITAGILPDLPGCTALAGDRYRIAPGRWRRRRATALWALRIVSGKLLSVARLFKTLFTFDGAVDYAVWKIERHTGRPLEISDAARRRPWLGGWVVLWRLYRSGRIR